MKLISFTGKMGSGKSTAIDILARIQPLPVIQIKFAAPIYDIQEFCYDRISSIYQRPETFIKDRKLLQWIGTEWGREVVGYSIWVDIWKQTIKQYDGQDVLVVCDDVRFLNEAEATHSLGGIVVLINNPRQVTTGIQNHISESGVPLKNVDVVIANDGTLEEFEEQLTKMITVLGLIN